MLKIPTCIHWSFIAKFHVCNESSWQLFYKQLPGKVLLFQPNDCRVLLNWIRLWGLSYLKLLETVTRITGDRWPDRGNGVPEWNILKSYLKTTANLVLKLDCRGAKMHIEAFSRKSTFIDPLLFNFLKLNLYMKRFVKL